MNPFGILQITLLTTVSQIVSLSIFVTMQYLKKHGPISLVTEDNYLLALSIFELTHQHQRNCPQTVIVLAVAWQAGLT